MVALAIVLLVAAHVRSRSVLHKLAREEWQEVVGAEADFRGWLRTRRQNVEGGGDADRGGRSGRSSTGSGVLRNRFSGAGAGATNGSVGANGGVGVGVGVGAELSGPSLPAPLSASLSGPWQGHGGGVPALMGGQEARRGSGGCPAVQRQGSEGLKPCAHRAAAAMGGRYSDSGSGANGGASDGDNGNCESRLNDTRRGGGDWRPAVGMAR
jgi:hypothetical protein